MQGTRNKKNIINGMLFSNRWSNEENQLED